MVKIRLFILCMFCLLSACHVRRHAVKENTELQLQILSRYISPWIGTPYKYGGNDMKGIDCSGLVCQVFQSAYGIKLPRTAKQQYEACEKISLKNAKPGDLIFFDLNENGVSHVGIIMSDTEFIHASSSKGVMVTKINNSYFWKNIVGVGRIKK